MAEFAVQLGMECKAVRKVHLCKAPLTSSRNTRYASKTYRYFQNNIGIQYYIDKGNAQLKSFLERALKGLLVHFNFWLNRVIKILICLGIISTNIKS